MSQNEFKCNPANCALGEFCLDFEGFDPTLECEANLTAYVEKKFEVEGVDVDLQGICGMAHVTIEYVERSNAT